MCATGLPVLQAYQPDWRVRFWVEVETAVGSVYAIANRKGGVGKTTTCVSLAAAFSAEEKRILLLDCDPQGNLTTSLGFDPNTFDLTLYNLLVRPEEFDLSAAVVETAIPGLDLVPSNS